MRVPPLVPGAAVTCAVLLAGCGSGDGARTVTVTTTAAAGGATTVSARRAPDRRSTTPGGPTTAPAPPATSTTAEHPTRPGTTTGAGAPVPPPEGERDEGTRVATVVQDDPVGGTTPAAGRATGTGYSVRVPDGWNDGARRFEGSGTDFDLTYVKGRGTGITSNILVARDASRAVRGRSIDALRGVVRRRITDVSRDATVVAGPRRRVDGEDAISFLVHRTIGGTAIVQRQVAVVRGDVLFTVGLNAARATYGDDGRVFSAFLRSWRWR